MKSAQAVGIQYSKRKSQAVCICTGHSLSMEDGQALVRTHQSLRLMVNRGKGDL